MQQGESTHSDQTGAFPPDVVEGHITLKELYVVYVSLHACHASLCNVHLYLEHDNQEVLCMLHKVSMKSTNTTTNQLYVDEWLPKLTVD